MVSRDSSVPVARRVSADPDRRAMRLGYSMPGGGRVNWVEAAAEYRGTTVQTCGLYPFTTGSGTPMIGVPIGRHLYTGATVCFDPVSWFTRTTLINTPSMYVESEPGMGKSTMVRRIVLGLAARGVTPLILGDLKPDYAQLVAALGGQVLRVGPGLHSINPLDAGPWRQVLNHVPEREAQTVRAGVVSRRLNMVTALATMVRRGPLDGTETAVLSAALSRMADREGAVQPVLGDVLRMIQDAPPELRAVTLWHDDKDRYLEEIVGLRRTFLSLLHGPLGKTFGGQTTAPIDLHTPAVCVDISSIDEHDVQLTAAALMSTWAYGFGQVEAAHYLSDLGMGPKRNFFVVVDEAWRAMRAAPGVVDSMDGMTRLDRAKGTGRAYINHSLTDADTLASPEDRVKARGFAERSSVLCIGAVSDRELDEVSKIEEMSLAERREILGWSSPPSWQVHGDEGSVGLGNFLIKVGSRPGIPVHLEPTQAEKRLGNTNARWNVSAGRQ